MRIKKISIKNCGPISEFNEDLSNLNVVYGKNEQGKSFLVEFLIKCLFKDTSYWGYLRKIEGSGKVILEGLANKDIEFSLPSKSKKEQKLEDYFEKDPKGLPPSLSKLLVVKGGEFEIVKNEKDSEKDLIKDILSSKRLLDSVKNKISSTIQKATIEGGKILSIDKRGEGEKYFELEESLENVNDVIDSVSQQYEKGEIKNIEIKIKEREQEKENLLKAKRHKAYLLSEEINKLEEELAKLPQEKISELKNDIEEFNKKKEGQKSISKELDKIKKETEDLLGLEEKLKKILEAKRYQAYCLKEEIKQKESELEKIPEDELSGLERERLQYNDKNNEFKEKLLKLRELKENTKYFEWLKGAKEHYLKYLSTPAKFTKFIGTLPYFSLLFLLVATVLILFGQKIWGAIFMLLIGISIVWYLLEKNKYFVAIKQKNEIKNIRDKFKEYFESELNNIADIESILNEQSGDYNRIGYLKDEISKIQRDIQNAKLSIQKRFKKLLGKEVDEQNWNNEFLELKQRRKNIQSEIDNLKEKFNKLDVDETDFVKEDPGIEYKKSKYDEISKEVDRLKELKNQEDEKSSDLQEYNDKLEELEKKIKQGFFEIIGEKPSEEQWKRKIDEIERERKDISDNKIEKEGELKGLEVSEKEYERQDPGIEYSSEEIKDIENRIKKFEEELKNQESRLSNLKLEICKITDSDISTEWNSLIGKLYSQKEETIRGLKDAESNIIAGKLVYDTIEELLREEDEKIVEVMNSEGVINLLLTLTKRYNKLSFDDKGALLIGSDYETFLLKDLSTGAKEQVFLALRIGFAKKIMQQDSAFLILDDAFQHSDYERRPILVDSLVNLAEAGWQIIYLTMDDNIKELFEEKAKRLKDGYKKIELQVSSHNTI